MRRVLVGGFEPARRVALAEFGEVGVERRVGRAPARLGWQPDSSGVRQMLVWLA